MDYLGVFSSAHLCFSVAGHSGQNHKKADMSLKINFFQIFRSRFGFLMQFYHYPWDWQITSHDQELLIFGDFLKIQPTVIWDRCSKLTQKSQFLSQILSVIKKKFLGHLDIFNYGNDNHAANNFAISRKIFFFDYH